jgi:hypothetical protein
MVDEVVKAVSNGLSYGPDFKSSIIHNDCEM